MYEGEEPTIYVLGVPFLGCSFLLLKIDVNKVSEFDEIESIDEVAEKLDASMENDYSIIIHLDFSFSTFSQYLTNFSVS